jgi:hypothetical protein
MGDTKTTGADGVPGFVLTVQGEDCLTLMTELISNIHETGELSKDFTEVTKTALKKKLQKAATLLK